MDKFVVAFRQLDTSGSGRVPRKVFEEVIDAVGLTVVAKPHMEKLFRAFDELGDQADGSINYEKFFSWLLECEPFIPTENGARNTERFSLSTNDISGALFTSVEEPSLEEVNEMEAAVATVLNMVELYPSSKKIASILRKNNLILERPLSDTDLELQMALAALRASSLHNIVKKDMRQQVDDMTERLTQSQPADLLDEREAQICRKRERMSMVWMEEQTEAKRLETSALHRFDSLRLGLQEKLVPDILRDLERYDAAMVELDQDKLTVLIDIGKPIFERAAQRLRDIFNGKLRQPSLAVEDGTEQADGYDSVSCVNRLYSEAETNSWHSDALAKNLARESGGRFRRGPLKSKRRMIQKTEEDNAGDYLLLCDIDRNSVEFESLDAMSRGLLAIERLDSEGYLEVVRIKNRLDPNFRARSESGGYRDILMNYRLPRSPNPLHISELQLHLKQFLAIKGTGGHETYNFVRTLHIFDPELTYHFGRFDQGVAAKVRLGIIVNLDLQGGAPDWQLLQSALRASTSRVERLNLQGCGGNNEEVAGVIEALAVGPTRGILEKLSLAGDDLTKAEYTTLPWQTLACLSELLELDLENGILQGPLPESLFEMKSLKQLELSLNPLAVPFPTGILNLTKLTILMLRDCNLCGAVPNDFAQHCSDIEVLGLARNSLEPDSVVSALCGLIRLTYADVRGIALLDYKLKIENSIPPGCKLEMDTTA